MSIYFETIKIYIIIFLNVFLLLAVEAQAVSYSAYVTNVLDGDSFEISEQDDDGVPIIIRLLGINTNEPGTCHASDASDRLKELIEFKTVTLSASDADLTLGDDSLGRKRPARFVDIGSLDIGEVMLEDSLAIPYPNETDRSRNIKYLDVAALAEQAGEGIWDNNYCGNGPSQNIDIDLQVSWDAVGDDRVNINGEWIDVINTSSSSLSLNGWRLRDPSTRFYSFTNGDSIPANSTIRVFVGSGTDSSLYKYWGNTSPIYTNDVGQGTFLLDPDNDIRATFNYPCSLDCSDDLIGKVEIEVNYDAVGDDNFNPNGEWVDIKNNTDSQIPLYGYFLESYYHFEINHVIPANDFIRIRVGEGIETNTELFVGRSSPYFTNSGGSIALRRSDDVLIDQYVWPEPDVLDEVCFAVKTVRNTSAIICI